MMSCTDIMKMYGHQEGIYMDVLKVYGHHEELRYL